MYQSIQNFNMSPQKEGNLNFLKFDFSNSLLSAQKSSNAPLKQNLSLQIEGMFVPKIITKY